MAGWSDNVFTIDCKVCLTTASVLFPAMGHVKKLPVTSDKTVVDADILSFTLANYDLAAIWHNS